ncbi:hypothetical protein AB0I28_05925 [Phytomonospora sp. NPDC050363]|uniref:hypothetical protein n=1 Tax=Phytomonospora sp. NPDC050363 TaxID=3155642 RepID=UPI0033D54525
MRWAGRVRTKFPDGQLFADLGGRAGRRPPVEPLGRFLRVLEAPYEPSEVDEAVALALLAAMLAERRVRAEADAVRELAALCGRSPRELGTAATHLACRPSRRITAHVRSLRVAGLTVGW